MDTFLKFWQKNKRRNLWQHPLWEKFQEAIGRKTWKLEVPGAQALVVRRVMSIRLSWLEVPRGPLFEDAKALFKIIHAIKELGQKEKAVFIRFSCYDPAIVQYDLRERNYDYHPQTTLALDLSLSEEDLLEQMKPKGRYNIKVAQKHNVEVAPSTDIVPFYAILQSTAERDGFQLHPVTYYQTMLETLGDHAQLITATYEGRVIAGGIFVYLDDWAIYYYGASDIHYRNVMAPYLVQWEAIREAKKRGCKYYDFLGISPEGAFRHPWKGVTDFKLKFGGKVVSYPQARELVLRRWLYLLYRVYKGLRS